MPTTIVAIIIIVFALLPGYPAYKLYKSINGIDWRTNDWEKIIIVVGFSLAGFVFYVLFTTFTGLPSPIYVFPDTFTAINFTISTLPLIAKSLLGHFIVSLLISAIVIFFSRIITKVTRFSNFPSAWDNFINFDVSKHWVIVKTKDGDAYAGILDFVDSSVTQGERDIILKEPAKYDKSVENYKVLEYQFLFLPSSLICSIGVVADSVNDNRVSKIGTNLFPTKVENEDNQ